MTVKQIWDEACQGPPISDEEIVRLTRATRETVRWLLAQEPSRERDDSIGVCKTQFHLLFNLAGLRDRLKEIERLKAERDGYLREIEERQAEDDAYYAEAHKWR